MFLVTVLQHHNSQTFIVMAPAPDSQIPEMRYAGGNLAEAQRIAAEANGVVMQCELRNDYTMPEIKAA